MSASSGGGTRTSEFLAHILPAEGLRVVAIKTPGGMRHVFCATNDEAAHAIDRAADQGFDAYHACATYQNAARRTGENVLAVKAFWLDVDVGDGKPYPDLAHAADAVVAFLHRSGLPAPCVVTSGRGYHLYWPLDVPLSPAEWTAAARRLRTLVELSGLAADPARTADIASILRPPGSLNFKYDPPLPVTVGALRGPYATNDILSRLGPILPPELIAHGQRMAATARVVSSTNETPSYAAAIVDRCAQLAALRDSGGKLPEPEWYAALCLLAHCEDGVELAHQWSSGDDRYTKESTDAKLEHALRASGPTTCGGFEARNAARCGGCPQYGRITSPIQLGRPQVQDSVPAAPPAEVATPLPEHLIPAPPWPFQRDRAGRLLLPKREEDGTVKTQVVYEHPLYVSGVRKGESTDDTSVVVTHFLPKDGWAEVVVPWRDHSPQTVLNLLGNKRVWLTSDNRKPFVDYIMRAGKEALATKVTEMEYDQFGWKDNCEGFLLGRDYYPVGAAPRVVGIGPEIAQRAQILRPAGNYDAWRNAANKLFAGPQQGLMLLASFAAPLMRLRLSEGGAILSGISQQTGKGKSVSLAAANSVWGGKWALDMNRTDTVNSRFRSLALMAHLPIIFDELRNRDPEVIKDFVLSFSDGRDKNRLDVDGKLKRLNGGWSTLLLSCSNLSLAQTVSYDGEQAQMARILEYQMELPPGLSVSDGNNLRNTLETNYGHAGRDFLTNLTRRPEILPWVRERLELYAREYEPKLPGTENRLYIATLAAIKVAAILVKEWGILEFSIDRIMDFALLTAREMKNMLYEMATDPAAILGRFINENWNGCIAVEADVTGANINMLHIPRDPPVMRYTRDKGILLIDQRAIRAWCTERKVITSLLKRDLQLCGIMQPLADSRKVLGAGTLYAAAGAINVWVVNAKHERMGHIVEPKLENVVPMRLVPTPDQVRGTIPR